MAEGHYLALYRKYRPRTFEDVRGRDAIVRTLKNQIMTGRIAHSYLFCGTRGTGKTTIAKIYAKAVNCEDPRDGSPCGECPSCRAIEANADLNVAEMDAASNNSVDDIRRIIEQVAYSPTQGRYRIYILDEAHMLSASASNALLKTLEEPPSYAIFILATTEPNKLPVTILSRCQRFDFGRLPAPVIEGRLREVAEMEGLTIEDKAYHYLAGAADGSMRDGLSLLDQCNAFNYGNAVLTYERTLEILGAVDTEVFSRLFTSIHAHDVQTGLAVLDEILMQGRDMVQFITDYTWYLRNLMLLKASEKIADSLDVSAENLQQMIAHARDTEMEEIMRGIRIFSALISEIRFSASRRILTEMAIIRACRPAMDGAADGGGLENLTARIRSLEDKLIESENYLAQAIGQGRIIAVDAAENPDMSDKSGRMEKGRLVPEPRQMTQKQKADFAGALPEDLREVAAGWTRLRSLMPPGLGMLKGYLGQSIPRQGEGGCLLIELGNPMAYEHYKDDEETKRLLQEFLLEQTGKQIRIEFKALDNGGENADNYPDLRPLDGFEGFDKINMDIETED